MEYTPRGKLTRELKLEAVHTDEGRLALPGCGSGRVLESPGGLGDAPTPVTVVGSP